MTTSTHDRWPGLETAEPPGISTGLGAAAALTALALTALALAAAGLLAGSVTAVLAYRYLDVGNILFLPDMYEPAWFRDKTLSAIIEAAGALVALGGARTAWRHTLRTAP